MCRFIMYHGPKVVLSTVVIDPEHGMLQQSKKAHCIYTPENLDGYGLAWYNNPLPSLYKNESAAWSCREIKQIASQNESHCFFAHVRAASFGNVSQVNCHPFTFKNMTFMHNGSVPHFRSIKQEMLNTVSKRVMRAIKGSTDSEVVFAMFLTHFESISGEKDGAEDRPYSPKNHTKQMAAALRATLHNVHEIAISHELSESKTELKRDGADTDLPDTKMLGRLNLAVTNGTSSIACRYVTSSHDPHTLYLARGAKLAYKDSNCFVEKPLEGENEDMLIVSSEPLGSQYECEMIERNHMVMVGPENYFKIQSC